MGSILSLYSSSFGIFTLYRCWPLLPYCDVCLSISYHFLQNILHSAHLNSFHSRRISFSGPIAWFSSLQTHSMNRFHSEYCLNISFLWFFLKFVTGSENTSILVVLYNIWFTILLYSLQVQVHKFSFIFCIQKSSISFFP